MRNLAIIKNKLLRAFSVVALFCFLATAQAAFVVEKNELRIVMTPDYFPVIWMSADEYGIDFTYDPAQVSTCVICFLEGAVEFRSYQISEYVSVSALYDANGELIGTIEIDNTPPPPVGYGGAASAGFSTGKPETFGYTKGDFSVSESGASTYHIPIQIPPATAGMAPDISINYTSNGSNGLLGLGWSIEGLSAISRCGKSVVTDGENRRVNLTPDDRFCVDGQRLIAVSGNYGASGTIYRTELDSYTKYTSHGTQGNGPEYFTTETKSGLIMTYGYQQGDYDSRIEAGNNTVLSWNLGKVEDTVGNYYLIDYTDQFMTSIRPSRIDYAYTANGGSNNNSIVFNYKDRADSSLGFIKGLYLGKDKILDNIEINANGSLVKQYWFGYEYDKVNNIPVVNKIQECAISNCKPATTFSYPLESQYGGWSENTSISLWGLRRNDMPNEDSGVRLIDINGDGLVDQVASYQSDGSSTTVGAVNVNNGDGTFYTDTNYKPLYPIVGSTTGKSTGSQFIDVNGDGLVDQVYSTYTNAYGSWGYYYGVAINTGSGWSPSAGYAQALATIPLVNKAHPDDDQGVRFIDLNGDHLVDIVAAGFNELNSNMRFSKAYINTGSGWVYNAAYEPLYNIVSYGTDMGSRFVDLNGDGLVDHIQAFKGTSSVVNVALNTGSGWQESTQYSSPLSNIFFTTQNSNVSSNDIGIHIIDMDGDGLVDIVGNQYDEMGTYTKYGFRNTGSGWVTDLSIVPPHRTATYSYELGISRSAPSRLVDINGDGLVDQIYAEYTNESGSWQFQKGVAINTGDGWFSDPGYSDIGSEFQFNNNGLPKQDLGVRLVDVNNDGLVDLVKYKDTETSVALLNTGSGWVRDTYFYAPKYPTIDSEGRSYGSDFIDMNGDGFLDQVYSQSNGWPFSFVYGNTVSKVAYNIASHSNLTGISIPNGLEYSIDYKNTTDKTVYQHDGYAWDVNTYSVQSRPPGEPVDPQAWDAFVRDVTPGMDVVASYHVSDGTGGENETEYFYRGFKYHPTRGSLGFRVIEDKDVRTNIMTMNTYRQDFPYTGMLLERVEGLNLVGSLNYGTVCNAGPDAVSLYLSGVSGSATLSKSTSESCAIQSSSAPTTSDQILFNKLSNTVFSDGFSANGVYAPHVTEFLETENDPVTGDFINTVQTETDYDVHGNALWMLVTTSDHSGVYTRETINDYDPNTAHLGRLLSVVASSTNASGNSQTRVSSFTYYDQASQWPGLLKDEIVEPHDHPYSTGNPNLTKITTYEYDDFGNKSRIVVKPSTLLTSSDEAYFTPREAVTVYDAEGLFVDYVQNAYGQIEDRAYERTYGNMMAQTGPNLLTTSWQYDEFGRKIYEYRHDGTQTEIIANWCQANCVVPALGVDQIDQTAAYYVTKRDMKGGVVYSVPETIYYDILGREIRRSTEGLTGEAIYKDTIYDAWGHMVAESSPYFSSTSDKLPTVNTYDKTGRIETTHAPDSGFTRFIYNGLSTTTKLSVINTAGSANNHEQERVEVKNALGHTLSVTDSQGQLLTFVYDAFGNQSDSIVRASDHGDFSNVSGTNGLSSDIVTHIEFDILGRKISMTDPDMGQWSYVYNAAGELVRQTDAKLQVTRITYDLLGRMVNRQEYTAQNVLADSASWVYYNDTDLSGCAVISGLGAASACAGKLVSETNGTNFSKFYYYNEIGLPVRTRSSISSINYDVDTTYDTYARVQTVTYPDSVGSERFAIKNIYQNGYHSQVTNLDESISYWQANQLNARGALIEVTLGNGSKSWRAYDDAGRINMIDHAKSTQDNIYHGGYSYDSIGNLATRATIRSSVSGTTILMDEEFLYDNLNRLTTADIDGITQNYVYDGLGNILQKNSASQIYRYNEARPHAVAEINGVSYTYDANGNMVDGNGKTIDYNVNNKPESISKGGSVSTFQYGPNRLRYYQYNHDDSSGKTLNIYYVSNVFEKISDTTANTTSYKHFIQAGGETIAIHTRQDNQTSSTRYLHRDYQGSVVAITDENEAIVAQIDFHPFGARRSVAGVSTSIVADIINRGYTGHEHLDNLGLIHMNGRVYDPDLGRFLSADPNVQAAKNLQNLNRYSYVMNNPMSMVDPSGFWHKKLFKKIKRFVKKYGRTIAAIAIAVYLPGLVFTNPGIGANMFAGLVSGLVSSGGDLNAAVLGAWSAGALGGIGFMNAGIGKVVAHGIVGGVRSMMSGGKFGTGFVTGAITQAFSKQISKIDAGNVGPNIKRAFAAAALGGAVSKIGGGKFKNGALTGAFSRIFNDDNHETFYKDFGEEFLKEFEENYPVEHGMFKEYAENMDMSNWNDYRMFEVAWRNFEAYASNRSVEIIQDGGRAFLQNLYGPQNSLSGLFGRVGVAIGVYNDVGTGVSGAGLVRVVNEALTINIYGPQVINESFYRESFETGYDPSLNSIIDRY